MRRRGQAAGGGAGRARRLALRPQGHAGRRRPACVRPLARERGGLRLRTRTRRRDGRDAGRARRRLRRRRIARPSRALAGRFVPPGPAGAPARGRLDVLPTGRNLFAIDPALRPDPQRLGDRPPRRRGGARALRAGSGRMAAADRARSLGLGDDAHRRRRPRAGLRAARLPPDLGHGVEPRQRLRDPAARRCSAGRGST